MEEKRNLKAEVKEAWSEAWPRIKIGAICLGTGLMVGFIKGVLTEDKRHTKLLEKLPYEPEYEDIDAWVMDHMDEVKEHYDNLKDY